MALSVSDFLRVVLSMATAEGNLIQNVFAVTPTSTGTGLDEADVISDLTDWVDDMMANVGAYVKSTTDPVETRIYKWDSVNDDWDEVGTGSPVFTTGDTGQRLPSGVAALINARTTDPDVSGKKYLGGFTEVAWDDGNWVAAFLTALANFAADWGAEFTGAATGADFQPVIWSPTNQTGYIMSEVYTVPTVAAYQRRRKPGVGS